MDLPAKTRKGPSLSTHQNIHDDVNVEDNTEIYRNTNNNGQ